MNETSSIISFLNLKKQISSDSILIKNDSLFQLVLKNQREIISTISNPKESRIIEFMSNDLFWTIIGAIIGGFITFIFWLGKWVIDSYKYKKTYSSYEGLYLSTLANNANDTHYILKLY